MVVRAMWDIGGRDKKVKLELNDRVRILVCTRAAGLILFADGPRASGAVHFKFTRVGTYRQGYMLIDLIFILHSRLGFCGYPLII